MNQQSKQVLHCSCGRKGASLETGIVLATGTASCGRGGDWDCFWRAGRCGGL